MRSSRLFLCLLLLALFTQSLHADETHEESAPRKDTCKVGLFITSLYDIDYPHQSFSTDFWTWFLYTNDSLDPAKTVEVSNAKSAAFESADLEKKHGINWGSVKCKAMIKQAWDVRDFPFDHQTLKIVLEDALHDTSALVYIPDIANSHLSSMIQLDGWKIGNLRLVNEGRHYETSYGDPDLTAASSTYPAVVAYVELSRNAIGLFFKLFSGVYIAFAICMIVFFISVSQFEARLSLAVGAIFATVANKYVVDSQLPPTSLFTLVDKVHAVTFLFIFFIIIASVISMAIYQRGKRKENNEASLKNSVMVDRYSFVVLLVAYIAVNAFFILRAV